MVKSFVKIKCPKHGVLQNKIEYASLRVGNYVFSDVPIVFCESCACYYSTSMLLTIITNPVFHGYIIRKGKMVHSSDREKEPVRKTSVEKIACEYNDKHEIVVQKEEIQTNPRNVEVPVVTCDKIYLTNKQNFLMAKECPYCGKRTTRATVQVQSDIRWRGGYKTWLTDRLRFCTDCEIYYIAPDILSKINARVEEKIHISLYIWPINVQGVHYSENGKLLYVPKNVLGKEQKEVQSRNEKCYDLLREEWLYVEDNTLYVHKGRIICQQKKHEIEQATALMSSLTGETIKLNVCHCKRCNKFFIHYDLFEYYRKEYEAILGAVVLLRNEYFSSGDVGLNEESALHLLGYNVTQRSNLSTLDRQKIIAAVIDNGTMSKENVINLISYQIRLNKSRKDRKNSIEKWEEDLFFAEEYNIAHQMHYKLHSVAPYFRNRFIPKDKIEKVLQPPKVGKYTGRRVRHVHSEFGEGKIVAEYKDNVTIRFDNGKEQMFSREIFRIGLAYIIE